MTGCPALRPAALAGLGALTLCLDSESVALGYVPRVLALTAQWLHAALSQVSSLFLFYYLFCCYSFTYLLALYNRHTQLPVEAVRCLSALVSVCPHLSQATVGLAWWCAVGVLSISEPPLFDAGIQLLCTCARRLGGAYFSFAFPIFLFVIFCRILCFHSS